MKRLYSIPVSLLTTDHAASQFRVANDVYFTCHSISQLFEWLLVNIFQNKATTSNCVLCSTKNLHPKSFNVVPPKENSHKLEAWTGEYYSDLFENVQ